MRGYWCRRCNTFRMKKKYTRVKIYLAFLLICATIFGFGFYFIIDPPNPLKYLMGPIVFLVFGVATGIEGGFEATRVCRICGQKVRKKRIPK